MSDDSLVDEHRLGDPAEALDHFTPEKMASATPPDMSVDEHGHRRAATTAAPQDPDPAS